MVDKGAHERNMTKDKKAVEKQEAAKCRLCGQCDSQRHMLIDIVTGEHNIRTSEGELGMLRQRSSRG